MARELDDAILSLRTNEYDLGLWILKTEGDAKSVEEVDAVLAGQSGNWFVREVVGMMRRTLARLEVSARSIYAMVEPGSCFVGSLLELAFAADRVYMLDDPKAVVQLSEMNFGAVPMANGLFRLAARFYENKEQIAKLRGAIGKTLSAQELSLIHI